MAIKVTVDTSVIVKGLVPPRRRKRDEFYEHQLSLHLRSREILLQIESGEYENHLPIIALIETACVVSRLSDEVRADLALDFVGKNSKLYSDGYLIERAIEIGLKTKASGFDVLFMACAEKSNSKLITDDRKMREKASDYGLDVLFLRDNWP
jgi:predicted nucleic acid-binding protein